MQPMMNSRCETQIEIILLHSIGFIFFVKFLCNVGVYAILGFTAINMNMRAEPGLMNGIFIDPVKIFI